MNRIYRWCGLLVAVLFGWSADAAVYRVTGTADNTDSATHGGNGSLATPFLMSSLRGAISAANAAAGADTIYLPAGTYTLTILGNEEQGNLSGDLDILGDLKIIGSDGNAAGDANVTIVKGGPGWIDKIFDINPNNNLLLNVTFQAITVRDGNNTGVGDYYGGGINMFGRPTLSGSGPAGTLVISNCVVTSNHVLNGGNEGGGGLLAEQVNTTISSSTFSNNSSSNDDGGGISSPGINESFTMTGTTVNANTAGAGFGGAGLAIRRLSLGGFPAGGAISISGSTFSNNHAGGRGGGLQLSIQSGGNPVATTFSLQDSTISGNLAGDTSLGAGIAEGAGMYYAGDNVPNLAVTLARDNVFNNSLDAASVLKRGGGGIAVGSGNLIASFCRIVGNSLNAAASGANQGSGLHKDNNPGTVTVQDDWWGSNAGPTGAGNTAVVSGGGSSVGVLTVPSWLVLSHTPASASIPIAGTDLLTASFLKDSTASAVSAANLTALSGLAVIFNNATFGTLSGASPSIASGVANATFTANGAGFGSAQVTVDGVSVTASISIPSSVVSITRDSPSPSNLGSVTWTVTMADAVSGFTAANFNLANTGLGGAPAITSVIPIGVTPAVSWTVAASSGSGSGTLGLDLVNATGVSAPIGNLTFNGEVYSIDHVPPDTSITSQPPLFSNSTSAGFTFTGLDNAGGSGLAGFQVNLDSGGFVSGTTPLNLTSLSEGSHTLLVRAVDLAGNVDLPPAAYTWTVDITPPTVIGVTSSSANRVYGPGDVINIQVNFSENVTVTGVPQLTLALGAGNRIVNYTSGSGSSTLVFTYNVQDGDTSADLDYVSTAALTLNGGSIKDAAGNDAALTLPTPGTAGSLGANRDLVIKDIFFWVSTSGLQVEKFTGGGGAIPVLTVPIPNSPRGLALGIGANTGFLFVADSGANIWKIDNTGVRTLFATTPAGTSPAALAFDAAGNLYISNQSGSGARIYVVGAAGGAASALTFTGTLNASAGLAVDGNGYLYASDAVNNLVLKIKLSDGSSTIFASGLSIPAGLTFDTSGNLFVVNNGNNTVSEITPGGTVSTFVPTASGPVGDTFDREGNFYVANNGSGTVSKASSTGVLLSASFISGLNGPEFVVSNGLLLDTTPPSVLSITRTGVNPNNAASLQFTVTFSESVTGVDASDFTLLTTGLTGASVAGVTGSGSTYTVTANTGVGDGTVRLDLTDDDTIIDAASNPLGGTSAGNGNFTAGQAYTVDKSAPLVTSVTSTTPSGSYKLGDVVNIQINFGEAVNVTGTPQLTLETGATDRTVNYVSGSGSATLSFTYTVQAGDSSAVLDYASATALALNGGTIRDAALNAANLTLATPGSAGSLSANSNLLIDGIVPSILSVSPPVNGTFREAQNLDFTVNYGENVFVTGTPSIALTVGATARTADYVSGSGTSALLFRYTIQNLELDTDGIVSASPVLLNGGTVKDAAGNDATLIFTVPTTTGVLVDAVAPSILSVAGPVNGHYRIGQNLDFAVTFSAPVNVVGTPTIALTIGSSTRSANYSLGTGTPVLIFRYAVQVGDEDTDGIVSAAPISLNGGTIRSSANNDAILAFTPPNTTAVFVDGIVPGIVLATVATDNVLNAAESAGDLSITGTTIGVENGRIVTVGLNAKTYSGAVSANAWSVTVPSADLLALTDGQNYNVTADVSDLAGNAAVQSTLSVGVDRSAPTIAINPVSSDDRINAAESLGVLAISGSTSGAQAGQIVTVGLNGKLYTSPVTANAWSVIVPVVDVLALTDGQNYTVTADVADVSGNPAAQASHSILVDRTPPSVGISGPSASTATGGPVTYTVTYGDAHFNTSTLAIADITLNKTDTADGAIAISGSGATRTVTISGITGNGTLGISVVSATANDQAGNAAPAAGPSGTFLVDNIAPTIALSGPSVSTTRSGPVTYTVTYSDANFNSATLTAGSVNLNRSGTANGSVAVSGAGTTRTITISGITGDGALGVSILAGTATDTAGNSAPATGLSASFVVDNTAAVAPVFTAITTDTGLSAHDQITADNTLFLSGTAESNSIVTLTRVGVGEIGTTNADVDGKWTFDYSGTTLADGNHTFTATTTDAAGNVSLASSAFIVTVDTATPVITTVTGPADGFYSAGQNLDFVFNLSEPVTVNTSGGTPSIGIRFGPSTRNATYVSGSGTSTLLFRYSVQAGETDEENLASVSPILLNGGVISDSAGHAAILTFTPPDTANVVVDTIGPIVVVSYPSLAITKHDTVVYTVVFLGSDFLTSTLSTADITLDNTGSATGTVSVSGTGASRTVTISNVTGDGSLGISLPAGIAIDLAGNLSAAPIVGHSQPFIVDNSPVGIQISPPSIALAGGLSTVSYTVTYTDPNFNASTLSVGDIVLNRTGSADGVVSVIPGTGSVRTVQIASLTGNGTLGISIAPGTASDAIGNSTPAAGPSDIFSVDTTVPGLTISAPSVSATRNGPVVYTVNYTDTDLNSITLGLGDVTVNKTGSANGTVSLAGTGATRTITISNITGDGTMGISVGAGTGRDLAGNPAPASSPGAGFIVDNTDPTISISGPSVTNTEAGPVTYTVTYTDANFDASTLTAADIILNKTGTANGVLTVSGTGNIRTVTISEISGSGTMNIYVLTGTGSDVVGHVVGAAGPSESFTVDRAELSIEGKGGNAVRILVHGIPGRTYTIQSAAEIEVPNIHWTTRGTATVNPEGLGTFDDTADSSMLIYRTVFP